MIASAFAFAFCAPLGMASQPATDPVEILEEEIDAAADAMRALSERRARSAALTGEALRAFGVGDFRQAERVLTRQLAIDPENFVVHYNLACAHAALGEPDAANADLRRAVELGFANRGHLERDPYLAPIRETDSFRLLLEHWGRIIDTQRRIRFEQTERWIRGRRVVRADDALRIDVISAHDEHETDQAMAEIQKVAVWSAGLLPVGEDKRVAEAPFVVLALPDQRDFLKWAFWTYGERARRAFAGIGGSYEHDEKRLVAQDLGPTLRHEFFHVLHWRDMDRLGQTHPIWIQEGLASLVEDMDPARILARQAVRSGDGSVPKGADPKLIPDHDMGDSTAHPMDSGIDPPGDGWSPVPSWRTNIVKRLARSGPLPDFETFMGRGHADFSTRRPLAAYAHARTIFLYLQSRGVLADWYARYTGDPDVGFAADASGIAAMEAVLDAELPEIESAYRAWVVNDLPMVPETGTDLVGVLGVDIEQGDESGATVTKVPRDARRRTGLRRLDVITAIDGRPVRDMKELVRVLSAYGPGETVRVDYRRVKLRGSSEVELVRRQ